MSETTPTFKKICLSQGKIQIKIIVYPSAAMKNVKQDFFVFQNVSIL